MNNPPSQQPTKKVACRHGNYFEIPEAYDGINDCSCDVGDPTSQQPTTEELIEISRSYLLKGSENSTSPHEWRLCERLQSLTEENERLKREDKLLRFTIKQVQNQERLAFTAFQGQEAQITHLKTLIGEAVEVLDDVNKHAYQRCDEALTKLKEASDE